MEDDSTHKVSIKNTVFKHLEIWCFGVYNDGDRIQYMTIEKYDY